MHVIINRFHFGNFRFVVELEAGQESEHPGKITLWVAEKVDVGTVPLREFTLEQLLYAVKEPQRSRLHQQLETEKRALEQTFAEKIGAVGAEQKGEKGNKRVRELRRQREKAFLQLEHQFRQQELLALERSHYNQEILQAESHLFQEERFLAHFQDGEIEDAQIRQFCFDFAFDPQKRAEGLATAAREPQPVKPSFEAE